MLLIEVASRNVFGPPSYGGSYKVTICLSVCPSVRLPVHLSVRHFSQEWIIVYFWFFAWWQVIGISKSWHSLFSRKTHFCPNLSFFWIFWKNLSLVCPGNNLKWRLILLIFHHQSHIWQNSDSRVMDQKTLFGTQINIKSFLQVNTIILGECGQAFSKYPK